MKTNYYLKVEYLKRSSEAFKEFEGLIENTHEKVYAYYLRQPKNKKIDNIKETWEKIMSFEKRINSQIVKQIKITMLPGMPLRLISPRAVNTIIEMNNVFCLVNEQNNEINIYVSLREALYINGDYVFNDNKIRDSQDIRSLKRLINVSLEEA